MSSVQATGILQTSAILHAATKTSILSKCTAIYLYFYECLKVRSQTCNLGPLAMMKGRYHYLYSYLTKDQYMLNDTFI